jgi:hypothetical protein
MAAVVLMAIWYGPWPSPCYQPQQQSADYQAPASTAQTNLIKRDQPRSNTAYYQCDEKDADWWLVRLAGLAAMIAALQGLMFYFQWRVMRESLGDTKDTAKAALDNAQAANKQVNALIGAERARFFLRSMNFLAPPAAGAPIVIDYSFINYGRSTAILLNFSIECEYIIGRHIPDDPVYDESAIKRTYNGIASQAWIGSHAGGFGLPACESRFALTPAGIHELISNADTLLIKGFVRFKDVFGDVYVQRFAVVPAIISGAFLGLPDTAYSIESKET